MAAAGDIYMVFDKTEPTILKAMGKMTDNNTIGASVNDNEVDTKIQVEKDMLKSKFAAKSSGQLNNGDSVIVKLAHDGKFLYIPGFVVDTNRDAGPYKIGVAPGRTIINVLEENIVKNRKLEIDEKGWFFSDIVLGQVVKGEATDNKELGYDEYVKGIDKIILGSALIDITADNGDTYTHIEFKLQNGNDIAENTVKPKSVVPYIFNTENAGKLAVSTVKTVFGGKKSRKQKTRKNTMPLQFAPGAKRAYLKRRKSSRK